jgi:hypothetical protein
MTAELENFTPVPLTRKASFSSEHAAPEPDRQQQSALDTLLTQLREKRSVVRRGSQQSNGPDFGFRCESSGDDDDFPLMEENDAQLFEVEPASAETQAAMLVRNRAIRIMTFLETLTNGRNNRPRLKQRGLRSRLTVTNKV